MKFFSTTREPHIEVTYSNQLDNIDGFLVTDGKQARMTIRASLSAFDKERGRETLLRSLRENPGQGVYMWRVND